MALVTIRKNSKFIIFRLLNSCENKSPCIIIIRDSFNYVFGAYCSDYIRIRHKFYGTGETFLFTFQVVL